METAGAAVDESTRARHIPALEGLRGVAVVAVMCYHGQFGSMRGGFLAVSTFFTLSGFLIGRLVHDEIRRTGRVDRRRFWARRARRLLPAALVTLAGIVAFHAAFGGISYGRLRGDVLAAVGYVENWWLLHTSQSYSSIFGVASPVQHFWSLAIEEQFYLVFPILCYVLHRVLRRDSFVAAAFAVGAAASFVAAALLARGDVTRAYYGTDARAAELLVGVVLAYTLSSTLSSNALARSRRTRVSVDAVGLVGIALLVILWTRVEFGGAFLFRGGTALNALCTAAIITACLQPGLVSASLSIRSLRGLGRISYGLYLVHWPIFLWLSPARVGVDGPALFALRATVAIGVAAAMYALVERPIRFRVVRRDWTFAFGAVAATATLVAATLFLSPPSQLVIDIATAPTPHQEMRTLVKATGARRILVVGDSLAWTVFVGLKDWGLAHHVAVGDYTAVGCGTGGPGTLDYLGLRRATDPNCESWHTSLPAAIGMYRPDTVLVVMGLADLSPRQFPDGRFLSLGDPSFDKWMRDREDSLTHILAAHGARVVWATYPHVDVHPAAGATGTPPFVENDPTRVDHLDALISATVAATPGSSVVDLNAFCRTRPRGEFDPMFRPDGVHLDAPASREVAAWLGPQLIKGK